MAKKRIHELAKLWQMPSKELLAKLERLSIKGKKSQSSLTEEEIEKVRDALGIRGEGDIATGEEKVVSERTIVEHEDREEVTAKERVTEARLKPNVIRRRKTRVEVGRRMEETEAAGSASLSVPLAAPEPALPQGVGFESPGMPPVIESPVAASEPVLVPVRQEANIEVPPPAEAEVSSVAPAAAEISAEHEPQLPEASQAAKEPKLDHEQGRGGAGQLLDGGIHRAKILGRIDLHKSAPEVAKKDLVSAPPGAPRPAGAPTPGAREQTTTPDRRKKKRKVIKKQEMFDVLDREYRPARTRRKKRALPGREQHKTEIIQPKASKRVVKVSEVITVGDLAKSLGVKSGEVIRKLMDLGIMATINQVLDLDTTILVAGEFGYTVENVAFDAESVLQGGEEEETEGGEEVARPPVVTVMGHVDHGKTSLLDAIRHTNVTADEAGGITQHIGAYIVEVGEGRRITFLDTPGHEAFTAMRARGAQVTDAVILVVAADDGVMPQTREAINHARAAGVPIVVAINKIDRPDADPERVKRELSEHGLVPEDWGGDAIMVPVSAKTGQGIDQLLEMLLLQADVLDLRADPARAARGVIVEAKLDRGLGPVATVLVQSGTLKVGSAFVCGAEHGRVRALIDDRGRRVEEAPPSTPVEILGLTGVPEAGEALVAVSDEGKARQVAEHRRAKHREAELAKTAKVSLDDLYQRIEKGEAKELRAVLKADVQGSIEALREALVRLSTGEVKLSVIHASVGGITESDVLLASASNAVIIGFNVRPEAKAGVLAEREGVDMRLYTVIYEAISDIRAALEGLLEPTLKEHLLGRAEVKEVFSISGVGNIAGCSVVEGKMLRSAQVRLVRDHVVVYQGKMSSLKRFKDDVREVAIGQECGIGLEKFQDIKAGDVIEAFEIEQLARHLSPAQGSEPQAERRAP